MISPRKPHLLVALIAAVSLHLTAALVVLFASAGGSSGTGGNGPGLPASRTIHVALGGALAEAADTAGTEIPSAAGEPEGKPSDADEKPSPAADEEPPEPEQAEEMPLTEMADASEPAAESPAETPPDPVSPDAKALPRPPEIKPSPPRPTAQAATGKTGAAPVPKRKPARRTMARAHASAVAKADPETRDADTAAPAETAPSPSRESHGGASAGLQAPVAASGASGAAGSSRPAAPGTGIGSSPDYIASLRAWLEKHKEYPRRARLRRQEGVVLLSFSLDRGGNLLSWRIARSSGHPTLDDAARDLIQRASPMPEIPSSFKSDDLSFSIPIRFHLE